MDDTLREMEEMLSGTGRHVGHTREQVGRCVYCSCGSRVQGRLNSVNTLIAKWDVVLDPDTKDEFVCYRGPKAKAEATRDRHVKEGKAALIRPATR